MVASLVWSQAPGPQGQAGRPCAASCLHQSAQGPQCRSDGKIVKACLRSLKACLRSRSLLEFQIWSRVMPSWPSHRAPSLPQPKQSTHGYMHSRRLKFTVTRAAPAAPPNTYTQYSTTLTHAQDRWAQTHNAHDRPKQQHTPKNRQQHRNLLDQRRFQLTRGRTWVCA
jgi:hypothetical protein